MKTRLLSLVIALFATTALWAQSFKYGDLNYNVISDNEVEVTGCDYNELTSINIPSTVTYQGAIYSVTRIGWNAFGHCESLISVTIPNTMTKIGPYAFWRCTGLTSITIPNSVTSIEQQAFNSCTGLTSITIPNSVTEIGGNAFGGCSGLTSITIPNSLTSTGDYTFCGCTSLTSITIPNNITTIGNSTFSGCTGLTSVTIPNSVMSIGERAFEECTSLTSITLPNSVTSIEEYAFFECIGLTSITIPNSVTSIAEYAFADCTGFTSIIIPNSVTSIGEGAFVDCTMLTSVVVEKSNTKYDSRDNCNAIIETRSNTIIAGCKATIIPNSVTSIGASAFGGCTSLTSIVIPNSVTSIGTRAFSYCTDLTSITIPNSVTNIGEYAFYECTGLTSITIPNSVTNIGEYAFYECTGLTSITFPNSITSIGERTFAQTGLTSIIIPNSVTNIGEYAFNNCTSLTSITISYGVTSIGASAFSGCTSLTSIAIPNSVTTIEDNAFCYCSSLSSIAIGNNDKLTIAYFAFNNCKNLETIICYAEVPPVCGSYIENLGMKVGTFERNRMSKMKLYVPAKAIEQYKKAEEWKDFGQIIPIGATTIETDDDKPIVQPSLADVTITWKIVPNADTYTIAITRGAETVCTLVFDADGVLNNIAYAAPARNGEQRHTPAAVMTEKGYRFTIIGLETGTQYDYNISAKDKNGKELQTYSGTFKTKEEGSAVENTHVGDSNTQQKVFRNGQVLIQRGGKMYTVTGAEVK